MGAPLKVSSARRASEQGALCPAILMAAGPAARVYISPSILRLQIEIISPRLCQPVLSLAPRPSTSQQAQGSHSWGLIKSALSHGFRMGWEREDPLFPMLQQELLGQQPSLPGE